MNNFLFLDIDGVLNIGSKKKPGLLDNNLVSKLNKIEAKFILTSSWGLHYNIDQINSMLQKAGFNSCVDFYLFGEETREYKIRKFLDKHEYYNYCVIDDRNINIDNLVLVNPSVGLTDDDVDTANLFFNLHH